MMNRNNRPDPERLWNSFTNTDATPAQLAAAARLLDEAHRLGALSDPQIQRLMQTCVASPWDARLFQFVNEALQIWRVRDVLEPDVFRPYPGPDSGLGNGTIRLGTIRETGLEWAIDIADLLHVALIGMTGSGKTYFLNGFLQQVCKHLPVTMVSLKPSDARLLVDPPVFQQAFRVEELRLSLFSSPPGGKEKGFSNDVIELLCKVFGLQLARSVLHSASEKLHQMYADYSVQKGRKYAPTPKALYAMLRRQKSKYAESACATLDIFCRATGDLFEWSQGYPLDTLLCRQSSLLIINSLTNDQVARFFVDWLMLWLAQYFEANGPNCGCQFVLVLDDGHRFLSVANEKDYLTPLSHQYLTIRQAGVRLVVVSQCPSDLATAVLSQSAIIIMLGGLTHGKDCLTMATAFGMDPRDWQRIQRVPRGEFIARESLGRYDRPFAGYVREFSQPTVPFSDADRLGLMQPVLDALPSTPAVPLDEVERALAAVSAANVRTPERISPDAMRLAQDILAFPWDLLPQRKLRLGLRGPKSTDTKDELVRHGWVREHKIPQRGGLPFLLEPLPPLAKALGQPLPATGKGGFLHAFAQHIVMCQMKVRGFTNVRKEQFFGSKAVDAVATDPNGALVGFEIAISLSNVVDNLDKDLRANPGFISLTTICLSAADVRQVRRMIAAAPSLQAHSAKMPVEPLADWLP